MSTRKATKTKWFVESQAFGRETFHNVIRHAEDGGEDYRIASVNVENQSAEVARLIAAAPELLEALKGEASVIDGKLCWCGMPNMIPYRGHDSGCEYNRELVAKAEGESETL